MSIPWCSAPAWYLEAQKRKLQVVAKRKLQVVATGATAAGGTAPFGEAVAAEPGQDHDVDVLHVGPHAQVLRELRKGVGFSELAGRSHGRAPCWRSLLPFVSLSCCRLWLELGRKPPKPFRTCETCWARGVEGLPRARCSASRHVWLVSYRLSCTAHPTARHRARTRGAGVRRPTRRSRSRSGRSRCVVRKGNSTGRSKVSCAPGCHRDGAPPG